MKHKWILAGAAALLATGAMAGEGKEKETGSSDSFKSLDADADGRISQQEAAANGSVASNFSALDSNSDGYVSEREFRANTMPKPKKPY